jgi:cyclopropane-fatty-acyl-phospholipid synthase
MILGPRRKYSCCYWPDRAATLAEAEVAALKQTCEHAELVDGQEVLELGCGWGSLSLWMAEQYPHSQITAMSNSHSQRRFIEQQASALGLRNLHVVTADINTFTPPEPGCYHRVVSVEMFEHLRNYERLFERIASWLQPNGRLLAHVFCHRVFAYPFETAGQADWMARNFFTGGMMPSAALFERFDRHLHVERQWTWSGVHYQRTAEAWLNNLDANRSAAVECLGGVYGADAVRWFQRWRMFFLAVAELFGYQNGQEWFVTHTLMTPKSPRAR